jgi:hypothetical protein
MVCWCEGLGGAKAADFSHNRLAALPPSMCQLTSLASLKLSHNCLQDAGVRWQQLCSALSSSLATLQVIPWLVGLPCSLRCQLPAVRLWAACQA